MRRSSVALLLGPLVVAASCIATAPEGIRRHSDEDAGVGGIDFVDGSLPSGGATTTGPSTTDPHAVVGVSPPHGPFAGGSAVLVSGKGFASDLRVWFGDVEATAVIAVSPTIAQVDVPAGPPGPVEVSAQNGDDASTRRSLAAGYSYDALYAVPSSGPVAGGTVISIFGASPVWDASTVAYIDGVACTTLEALSSTELGCTVPQGLPGTKPITVEHGGESVTALDAFTYEDSSEGYKGGLHGEPLAGAMTVLVFDNYSGDPIPGAYAIAGVELEPGRYGQAGNDGAIQLADPLLDGAVTVTVAANCHSPISFVDVPVDTVVAYLDPILSPECGEGGDPPPVGGKPTDPGSVVGEIVWPMSGEFQKGLWSNVPTPLGDHEVRVAYLLSASSSARREFSLPSSSAAIYEDSPGDIGYGFNVSAYPGNLTLYALAGIQNNAFTPVVFTAYAMGVVRGVAVEPDEAAGPVYLSMNTVLDQAFTLEVAPPPIGPKGPDRLRATVAIELSAGQFATLPGAQRTVPLPTTGAMSFLGLPPLDVELFGARYVTTAVAATGPSLTAPLAMISDVATTFTALPVDMTGFVAVPTLVTPTTNGSWDGRHLGVDFSAGALPPMLTVYDVATTGGLVRWTIAVPAGSHAIELPDLALLQDVGVPTGTLVIGVTGARFADFDYGRLRYSHLRTAGMDAYSLDYFNAHR